MEQNSYADVLQIAGWLLTVGGQVQVARRERAGFVTWIAANVVLILLSAHAGLWWCIGMYLTNIAVCAWSFRQWGSANDMRPLFVGKRS
jgi:hypothetical protein